MELIFGEVLRLTDKAVLFRQEVRGAFFDEWIPKSQIDEADGVEIGQTEIYVSKWFAEKVKVK